MARQDQQRDVAIAHFERATKLDAGFTDAFIGLGRTLIEGGRGADAVSPLQTAANQQPDNPAPHFYLATAYRQLGRREDASRESERQREASEKLRQAKEHKWALETGMPEETK
jgi:Flp pilus assembly protein TadD